MNIVKLSYKLDILFSTLWCIYFFFTVVLSVYDLTTVKRVDWKEAKNVSKVYRGYKASIVTRSFQNDNKKISRKYGALFEGINVYLWGINKKSDIVNISFYVRANDFDKISNNSSKEDFSFFGLRRFGKSSNIISLFLDIWKYNYSMLIGFSIIFIPLVIVAILKKIKNLELKLEDVTEVKNRCLNKVYIAFVIVLFVNMII